jgi:hypothetical protein
VLILSVGVVCAQECDISDNNIGIVNDDGVLLSSEFVIDDSNYGDYFDESGVILDNSSISDGDVIKLGSINNKDFILDKSLTLCSNLSSDVINNASFYFIGGSDKSIVENLNIVNFGEKSAFHVNNVSDILISDCDVEFFGDTDVISADLVDNFTVKNNDILFNGENGVVVNLVRSSVYVSENRINSTSYAIRTKDSLVYVSENVIDVVDNDFYNLSAIFVEDSFGEIFKNNITFFAQTNASFINSLMSGYGSNISVADNLMRANFESSYTYFMSGCLYFENCDGLRLSNNDIFVKYYNVTGLDDNIAAVYLKDCDDAILVANNVIANGHSYVYGLFVMGGNFNISDNVITVSSDMMFSLGMYIGGNSKGVVDNNIVQVYSHYIGYGIFSEWYDSGFEPSVNYTQNFILGSSNITYGMCLYGLNTCIDSNSIELYGNYTMGIFSFMVNGANIISDNDIKVNGLKNDSVDVGDLVKVQTVGIYLFSEGRVFNNVISSAGNYSIVNCFSNCEIVDNELVASILLGDDSVLDINNAVVENNTPVVSEYELTNSTFSLFFGDDGYLRNTISVDSLSFVGNFSNLVDCIVIDRPLYLLSKNASLSDIGIKVLSSDVFIRDFEFIIFTLSDAILVKESDNVSIFNNVFDVMSLHSNHVINVVESDDLIVDSNAVYYSVDFIGYYENIAFSLDYCNNVTFKNNIIESNSQPGDDIVTLYGFFIWDSDDVVILDNSVHVSDGSDVFGISLGGENFKVLNNTIDIDGVHDYAHGIMSFEDSSGLISGNEIIVGGDTISGMSLSGNEIFVENNRITMTGNFSSGIESSVGSANISHNMIFSDDSLGVGVYVFNGSASVSDNIIYLDHAEYSVVVEMDGTGIVCDNYLVAREYTGDASVNYDVTKASVFDNTPTMYAAILSGENQVLYYKNGTRYSVRLTDKFGDPLINNTVVININGVKYSKTTDENGMASIALGLNSGNYTVDVSYVGVGNYSNASIMNNITILTTVLGNDVVKIFRNDTQYYATFLDGHGAPLRNAAVSFNINGVFYERLTNDVGVAKLNINLPPGEYIITAINSFNGELHANTIVVLSSLVNNSDVVKYYKNGTQYKLSVLGSDGKVVGAGVSVRFNINGVFYERLTNEFGVVQLNINLPPGDYIITAEYRGCSVSNCIKVLSVLSASDISMKYRDGTQFVASLVDGQGNAYPGQTVTFNINGVFYNKVTNNLGLAKLNINLPPGEYIITSSYNGCNIANKITILS